MENVTRDAGGQADEQTRNSWSEEGRLRFAVTLLYLKEIKR